MKQFKAVAAAFLFAGTAGAGAARADPPTAPPVAAPDPAAAEENRLLREALDLVHAGKSADAITLLDRVIAGEEAAHRNEKRTIFSARSMMEVILYSGMGAEMKRGTVVLGPNWGWAVYLKGFSLVDLGRADEAKAYYDKAVALAPMNAQYQGELGEWYKSRKDWPHAFAAFDQASTAAEFSPDDSKSFEKRRALRGMGFVLAEQGKLDEAEKLFRQCLKLDRNDRAAKQELDYISGQRAKLHGS